MVSILKALEAQCVYPVPNNVCTDLQCLILGHHTPYKAGMCCLYRGMAITYRHRLQIKYTFFIKFKMINIDNWFLIRMSTYTFNKKKYVLKPVICEGRQLSFICHVEAVLEGFFPTGTP